MVYRADNPSAPQNKQRRLWRVLAQLVRPGSIIPTACWNRLCRDLCGVGTRMSAHNYAVELEAEGLVRRHEGQGVEVLPTRAAPVAIQTPAIAQSV